MREQTPSTFYNEIYHSDEEVLDTSSMNWQMCSRKKAWLPLMLRQGRTLCAQELNITRLVASSRCTRATQSLLGASAT